MAIRLFISHSSKDAAFVVQLIELIRTALDLRRAEIRATSVDGYRLAAGAHTDKQLREEVMDADVCLGVVTPDALESLYVAFELGARWGADKPLIPLLAPGVRPDVLRGPLGGINALQCTRAQLHQLVTDLGEMLGVRPEPPQVYERYLDHILSETSATDKTGEEAPPLLVEEASEAYRDLVLFMPPQDSFLLVRSRQIETAEQRDPWTPGPSLVTLDVVPDNPKTAAGLRALRQARQGVGLAYGNDAFAGQVSEARQLREGGEERWQVVFEPNGRMVGGVMSDVATEGYSADDIADLRARRILLGEALPGRRGSGSDMLDGLVQGMNVPLSVEGSPFPMVYETLGTEDAGLFLAACRLFGVLWLKLSGTVQDVWRLDLALEGTDTLRVDFEGQRRRVAVNADPPVIRVAGTCSLQGLT